MDKLRAARAARAPRITATPLHPRHHAAQRALSWRCLRTLSFGVCWRRWRHAHNALRALWNSRLLIARFCVRDASKLKSTPRCWRDRDCAAHHERSLVLALGQARHGGRRMDVTWA